MRRVKFRTVAIVVGQDWGSPTAEIVAEISAMERPERVRRLVRCNWYGNGVTRARRATLSGVSQ